MRNKFFLLINNKAVKTGVLCAVLLGVFASGRLSATDTAPGSAQNPLVSKDYVDGQINALRDFLVSLLNNGSQSQSQSQSGGSVSDAELEMIAHSIRASIKSELKQELLNEMPANSGYSYVPVYIEKNKVIIGGEGTELILRSGTASGYCPGENGLTDITDGAEIYNGGSIALNHMLIVPRGDGRGAAVTSDGAWFLVKGGYTVLN